MKLRGFRIYKFYLPLFSNYDFLKNLATILLIISILNARLSALVTHNLKQIIAYSSIMHMNMCASRLFFNKVDSVTRGLYLMCSHNVTSVGLSTIAEIMYTRTNTYQLDGYNRLFLKTPVMSLSLLILLFANISLPLTAGFPGKLIIFSELVRNNYIIIIVITIYISLCSAFSI